VGGGGFCRDPLAAAAAVVAAAGLEPFTGAFAGAPWPCAADEAPRAGWELVPAPPQPAITTARRRPAVASIADALRVIGFLVWLIVIRITRSFRVTIAGDWCRYVLTLFRHGSP
jgi:hypothetical protein